MSVREVICRTTMFFGTNGRVGPCPMPIETWCTKEDRGFCGLHAADHLRRKECIPADHRPLTPGA
jgi:hypothetical protein